MRRTARSAGGGEGRGGGGEGVAGWVSYLSILRPFFTARAIEKSYPMSGNQVPELKFKVRLNFVLRMRLHVAIEQSMQHVQPCMQRK